MADQLIHVTVKTRERTVYDGDAVAVSSVNEGGKFDVLAQHVNFISIIKDQLVVHKSDGTSQEFKLENGVLKNFQNQVNVYLGVVDKSATPPSTSS